MGDISFRHDQDSNLRDLNGVNHNTGGGTTATSHTFSGTIGTDFVQVSHTQTLTITNGEATITEPSATTFAAVEMSTGERGLYIAVTS